MKRPALSRPMVVALVLLGLFVLLDVALFGVLIFRSLSQREINRIILETRAEAEELAGRIAKEAEKWGDDLFTAVATNTETRTYIDQILSKREIVEVVRVLDKDKTVVFQSTKYEREGDDPPAFEGESELPNVVTERLQHETPFETVEVPVGNVGTFVIGLRREEIEQRLQVLRRDLLRQAGVISVLSLALLGTAYGFIVRLMRRSRRLEETAAEAERLAYVGTLASGLAHEIRSPLNSLSLNMQMLEEDLGHEAPTRPTGSRRLLSITQAEINRLERLVSDFLSYARPRELELREVTGRELMERIRDVYRGRLAIQGGKLVVEDLCDQCAVRVDPEQLHQLLLNLTENALQATKETGREPEVRLGVERQGDRVVLSVTDNGAGMTDEELSRATEVFYSKRKGGTGLGLAIVDRIVKGHDGEMRIASTPGVGTRAEVLLPAV